MTEERRPKLGPDDDLFVAVMGLGYAAQVDLLPGEVPLCAWDAAFVSAGTLYLTDQRLVWIRWGFGLPGTPKVLVISLDDIARVNTRRLGLGALFQRVAVVLLRNGEQRQFYPHHRGQPRADKIAEEINSILRERGLLRD